MAWLWLTAAGIFEVVWATALKFSRGFTVPGATAVTVAGMFISFFFLARAMKVLPRYRRGGNRSCRYFSF